MKHPFIRTLFLLLSAAFAALMGCGGGGGTGTSTARLQGNQAFRAASVGSYQALGAGIAYPFTDLQIASPTGSVLNPAGKVVSLFRTLRGLPPPPGRVAAGRSAGLNYLQALNLYSPGIVTNGNTMTLPFFTDAAGTQSAGSVIMTLPEGGADPTSYKTYPALVSIAVNITAGNLPCQGLVKVTFTGSSGANKMTGTVTLTKNNVAFDLDMALTDQLDVSGSISIHENGATVQAGNLRGKVTDTLQADVSVSPYGWTGTGTLNLVTGQMTLNLKTATGSATSASDASGSLDLNYADGTRETVTNAATAGLVSGNGTANSGSGSGSGGTGSGPAKPTYNAPVNLGAIKPIQINNKGQILGLTTDASQAPVFLQSATASPQRLAGVTAPFQVTSSALSMNNSGQIVGFGGGFTGGVIWQNATAQPQELAGTYPKPYFIDDDGLIFGQALAGRWAATAWSDPNTPFTMTSLGNYDLPLGMSADGQMVANTDFTYLSYWKSYKAAPQKLDMGTISYVGSISVNNSGQICGTATNGGAVYWASPTAKVQPLPSYSTGTNSVKASALGMNGGGTIVGSASDAPTADIEVSSLHAVLWKNLKIQDLNTLIPAGTGWTLVSANAINDQGAIVGTGIIEVNGKQQTVGFLLTPTQ